MITSLCLLATALTAGTTIGHPIVHGALPRDPSQFSFAVSLQRALRNGTLIHFCGGTYLGGGWILTANHCIVGSDKRSAIYAYIGGRSLADTTPTVVYRIQQVVGHQNYNGATLGGDIALLRMDEGDSLQQLDKWVQSTLLLPPKNNSSSNNMAGVLGVGGVVPNLVHGDSHLSDAADEECHIFGYGSDSFYGPTSDRLRYGLVQPLSFDRCMQMLGPVVAPASPNSGMFCAIGLADACRGDSGGGLVCRRRARRPISDETRPYILRGIISYGAGCGAPASPGVYTDVGFYRAWIDELIASSNLPASNA